MSRKLAGSDVGWRRPGSLLYQAVHWTAKVSTSCLLPTHTHTHTCAEIGGWWVALGQQLFEKSGHHRQRDMNMGMWTRTWTQLTPRPSPWAFLSAPHRNNLIAAAYGKICQAQENALGACGFGIGCANWSAHPSLLTTSSPGEGRKRRGVSRHCSHKYLMRPLDCCCVD